MKKNDEIIAVITAVLGQLNSRPDIKLKIKSIKRTKQESPIWATAGKLTRMERRLNS